MNNIDVFHRGSNDLIINPINSLTGVIYATGNVILKNEPFLINVDERFSGKVIINN